MIRRCLNTVFPLDIGKLLRKSFTDDSAFGFSKIFKLHI